MWDIFKIDGWMWDEKKKIPGFRQSCGFIFVGLTSFLIKAREGVQMTDIIKVAEHSFRVRFC